PDLPLPCPPSPLHLIQGDRNQLHRLFTNLVSNAIQYTPEQGFICLHVGTKMSHPKRQMPDLVAIQIQDTGIGIAPEDLPHIFERFYQVDPARSPHRSLAKKSNNQGSSLSGTSGSGLGLSIVKVIVDNHDGQIDIESEPKQGTTVTVTFPLHRLEPA
ncbi:cell wall metabolism sensor histidine kinase WalK, partial [Okeania sp. SIO2G5]|uniref:sensor histidine kinase n=1 Tax=Okeania sp. SIO2G5 TaxID=2607796 RepID=UPI0013C0EA10